MVRLIGSADFYTYAYDEERNLYIKTMRLVQGLAKARAKAKKFVLYTDVGLIKYRLFISQAFFIPHCMLTPKLEEAEQFAHGFDNPEVKRKLFEEKLGVKIYLKDI
jgi:hypothetical protein